MISKTHQSVCRFSFNFLAPNPYPLHASDVPGSRTLSFHFLGEKNPQFPRGGRSSLHDSTTSYKTFKYYLLFFFFNNYLLLISSLVLVFLETFCYQCWVSGEVVLGKLTCLSLQKTRSVTSSIWLNYLTLFYPFCIF